MIDVSRDKECSIDKHIKRRANILLLLQYLKLQFRNFKFHNHQTNNVCNEFNVIVYSGSHDN